MIAGHGLRIAWLGGAPMEHAGGAPGVVRDLLYGLAKRGHRIDCFFPGAAQELPEHLASHPNLTFIWGTSDWRWNRWYSSTKVGAFATGLISRGLASLRLRREITHRHRQEPYDLIYQNQSIESLGVPFGVTRVVPLVIRPDSHIAGELRWLVRERRLSFYCQPRYIVVLVATIMSCRALVQRVMIRRARLLLCISSVFRDHLVHDYRFPVENTVVVPNPVRLERFPNVERPVGAPATVLVPARISLRKGLEDVLATARLLSERKIEVRIRIIGGPSLWSDYTKLLEGLPTDNAEYAGRVPHTEIASEYARSDLMLAASKYEPFGQTVGEALAAGVPVVATSEVGAIEGVDRSVVSEVQPGDVEAMAGAIASMLERMRANPTEMRAKARSEAERLFAPEVVCEQISGALERLVEGVETGPGAASRVRGRSPQPTSL
jgi:glycosyltransferase involved in cell wall biosynthesis